MRSVNASDSGRKKAVSAHGVVIALLVLVALLLGGVAAKYALSKDGVSIFSAKEFYFTSNLLVKGGEDYVLNTDAQSITLTLGNNADRLRWSDDDVNYEVSVTASDGSSPSLDAATGSLPGGQVSAGSVTLSGLKPGVTYTVTAQGYTGDKSEGVQLFGYKETIKATFEISDGAKNVYKHVDATDPNFVTLTVWTQNLAGEVAVAFPDGLVPDDTDKALAGATVGYLDGLYQGGSFTDATSLANVYSSRSYRFFVLDATGVADSSFTVTLKDGNSATHVAGSGIPR